MLIQLRTVLVRQVLSTQGPVVPVAPDRHLRPEPGGMRMNNSQAQGARKNNNLFRLA